MKNRPSLRNRYVFIIDLLLITGCVLGSYVLRLELGAAFSFYVPSMYWMMGLSLIIKPSVYIYFGLYRRLWIYASMQEMKLIVAAVTTASILVSFGMVGLFSLNVFSGFPRSVLIIDWLLSIMTVGGVRFTLRLLAESHLFGNGTNQASETHKAMIIGAGDAGALVVREIQKNTQRINLEPIGFLDDDPAKLGQHIYGIPILGPLSELERFLENLPIDEVIITIPSAPGRVVRLVTEVCRRHRIAFRTMPGLYELLGGKVSVNRLRDVEITDLLRREQVRKDDEQIGETLGGKVILVTGAGGSIGRELCRQIARWSPTELILLGHGENSIFETFVELQEAFPGLPIHPVIADIRDTRRLDAIYQNFKPKVVFHAAAHKHVPLMEINVEDAITNNIIGTKNIVDFSLKYNVERLVMISTDKAILPVNVMGATKRIAEMLVLDAADRTGRSFSVVRFGNVLDSRGSVVPIFKRQIARGGPVTVTHPDMKRYFMTIPEAVYLVLQAASMGQGGETFVLNMGQQVRILDLVEDLIRLSGLEPGRDIEIIFTGIRPGEKLSEDLWDENHKFLPTNHPDIFRLERTDMMNSESLRSVVLELSTLAKECDTTLAINLMDEIIPGSAIRSTPRPEMSSID